ncbi:TetR/AcrR family transcriptional regulator [Enterococcus saccharolyticus]|uniref:HTH tetR-type domain-containing protein n=1 Tax=Candidatus Enterococcus willemsii TaxID=1857215 RepID=A0ABQ6Z2S5_9ENTE|nr:MULTISPECIES: TetR/AcrR family transcriptional regulator [Enterococcus]KAF1305700.1 hypothetical protein BAU17_00170 [Enterococcus sp. CU12B]MCD5001458.1 TetR/AcrR family transcriptional regulator [Enterococcus saccharolyticus]
MNQTNAHEDFIQAFWQLYAEKPLEKISVRALCELAGYNRTTFYAHFDNIYDLLDQALDRLVLPIKQTIQKVEDLSILFQTETAIQFFLSVFQTNGWYIGLIIKSNHHHLIENKIKAILLPIVKANIPQGKQNTRLLYIIEYQLSGVLGLLHAWFQNGQDMSEIELIQLLHDISSQGVFTRVNEEMKPRKDG